MFGESEADENIEKVGEKRGGKGKTNILSPPGSQRAAQGCCLQIRMLDRAVCWENACQNNKTHIFGGAELTGTQDTQT